MWSSTRRNRKKEVMSSDLFYLIGIPITYIFLKWLTSDAEKHVLGPSWGFVFIRFLISLFSFVAFGLVLLVILIAVVVRYFNESGRRPPKWL